MKNAIPNQLEKPPNAHLSADPAAAKLIDLNSKWYRSLVIRTSDSGGAAFDKLGAYRYLLWRDVELDDGLPCGDDGNLLLVMLNPNKADETRNDPTIRRCICFARSWGFSRLEVVNLFAVCAEKPHMLRKFDDPVGAHNDAMIKERAARAGKIIVAWGNHGRLLGRDADILSQLQVGSPLHCFGTTKVGMPRHPLYLRADVQLSRF
jgi:hypothetical protein